MKIGVSTANLYPMLIEDCLDTLLNMHIENVEIFLNTESEASDEFAELFRSKLAATHTRVAAVHSYMSGYEPHLLFSQYERRFQDGCRGFEKIFRTAAAVKAPLVVLHGDRVQGVLTPEESVKRFAYLSDMGAEHGVILAQENVVRFRASQLEYLALMRKMLGDKAHFVLDVKQCRRCGLSWQQVLNVMGDRVCHVHLSDADATHDCLPPGTGTFDFAALLRKLQEYGFDGCGMVELYRQNYENTGDLLKSVHYLQNILHTIEKKE